MHSRIRFVPKLVLITLAILASQAMSYGAQAQHQGRVITSVNLRKSPGMNTQILAILRPGEWVEILAEHQGWLQVTRRQAESTLTGWVFGKYISTQVPAKPPTGLWQEPEMAFPDQENSPQDPLGGQALNTTVIPGELQAPEFPLETHAATETIAREDSGAKTETPTAEESVSITTPPQPLPAAEPTPPSVEGTPPAETVVGSEPVVEVQVEAIASDAKEAAPTPVDALPPSVLSESRPTADPDTGLWSSVWLHPVLRFMAVALACLALGLALKALQLSRATRKRIQQLEQRFVSLGASSHDNPT